MELSTLQNTAWSTQTAGKIMTMKLKFTKMQGLGNDFVVVDAILQHVSLDAAQIQRIADRHFGVGCDQLLLVEKTLQPDADFRYRIFNADGGEVEQCGNGARCFVRFVHDHQLTQKTEIRVETACGIIMPRLEADGMVTVNMGTPHFEPVEIPFISSERALTYSIELGPAYVELSVLSMGNPHAVQIVSDIDTAPVSQQGPLIEHHRLFPQRVNAGFMQITDRGHIKLRVFERGTGETLACGTGACAAAVSGITRGLLDATVTVSMRGGDLLIRWEGAGSPVLMTGPAVVVFEGEIEL
jgi:diaminopimelate epimerase